MVLFTDQIKISKSLKKTLRNTELSITMDRAFAEVMAACSAPRKNANGDTESGTWIHPEMIEAYTDLHQQGIAHSIECWQNGELVGGLYGIAIGHVFFGESMFSTVRDSSKIALVTLCRQLERWGFPLIDCQIYSEHLASMGAIEIDRKQFVSYLDRFCPQSQLNTHWLLDSNLS
jgi:leucyl/phenylalanyl-tRNA--protein transferase